MASLRELAFTDLYIGNDFAEVTGVRDQPSPSPVPAELSQEVEQLRESARAAYKKDGEEEFALRADEQLYRVTYLREADGGDTYIFRKSQVQIRPITNLGFHDAVVEDLLSSKNTGMVLIVGPMGAGKTSALASIGNARLSELGGVGVAIEDPPETPLKGRRGKGRCLQVWARRRDGGYKSAIKKGLRAGATLMLLGEIRDGDTAYEGMVAAVAGHFVGATMHADGIVDAVQKLESWCGGRVGPRPGELLANGLSMVIWLSLEVVSGGVRLRNEVLFVRDYASVKAKIRSMDGIQELQQDVNEQAARLAWLGGVGQGE